MPGIQDYRHSFFCVVNPGHQFVGFGGDDGERRKDCSRCRIHPLTPQSGKSKKRAVGYFEQVFCFPCTFRVQPLPLQKSIGRNQTAVAQDVFERRFFAKRFQTGIERIILKFPVLSPRRHQSPLKKADSGRFAVGYHRHYRMRKAVVHILLTIKKDVLLLIHHLCHKSFLQGFGAFVKLIEETHVNCFFK